MKTNITLKGLSFGEIKVDEVNVGLDFSIKEAIAMKDLAITTAMEVTEVMPVLFNKVANAIVTHGNLSDMIREENSRKKVKEFLIRIENAKSIEEAKNIAEDAYYCLIVKHHSIITEALKTKEEALNKIVDKKEKLYNSEEVYNLYLAIDRCKKIKDLNIFLDVVKLKVEEKYKKDLIETIKIKEKEILNNL